MKSRDKISETIFQVLKHKRINYSDIQNSSSSSPPFTFQKFPKLIMGHLDLKKKV